MKSLLTHVAARSIDNSPDPAARTLAGTMAAASRVPRRQGSTRLDDDLSPAHVAPMEDEYEAALAEAEDDGDKTLYCFCQRVSFGEMIACDAPDCEHEWVRFCALSLFPRAWRWFADSPCPRSSTSPASASRASQMAAGSATSAGCVVVSPRDVHGPS